MGDDENHTSRSNKAHGTATTPRSLVSFREYYELDEARRKKRGKVDPVLAIINQIDALTKKVGRERNQRRRDLKMAQQNRALGLLAVHLARTSK